MKNTKGVLEALYQCVLGGGSGSSGACGDVLGLEQLGTLAEMVGFSLDDMSIYRLAWSWSCKTPLSITKGEFMEGMQALEVPKGSLAASKTKTTPKASKPEFKPLLLALRGHLEKVDRALHEDTKQFKQFYRFIFVWVQSLETREKGVGEVGISVDCAVELWRMLFPEYKVFKHLEHWIAFCTTEDLFRRKAVSKDLWEQLLEFASLECYDTYDVSDAWPSAMDDFVEYFRSTHAKSSLKG